MADVLLARTGSVEGFERHVVVKRIRPELAHDRRFIRMLLDEARVAATLHHQNIAQVHDVGEVDGEYFIAMEYVHGEDVRRLLENAARQRSHVPLGYAVAIVSAAAAGLHHAHDRLGSDRRPMHIVHRDVSPSNILIGYDGAIKVVDFGIATASLQREARGNALTGKLAYMSPEQCTTGAVDRRTDVYGLGVVLYELATTTPMIQGDGDRELIDRVVHGRITPPHSRRPELPRELSDIILRALATDPEQRFATAEELRVALDQFAWNAGLTAPTASLAAYLRQQFGERPEPWLELGDVEADDFEEMSVSQVVPVIEHSDWDESPRTTDPHHHAGAISHRRESLSTVGGGPESASPSAGQRTSPTPGTWSRWRALALIGPAAAAAVAAAIWFAVSVLVPRSPVATAPAAAVAGAPAQPPAALATAAVPLPAAAAPPPMADAAAPPADASEIAEAASGRGERTAGPARRGASSSGDGPARSRSERPLRVAAVGPRSADASPVRSRSERTEREAVADAAETPAPGNNAAPAGELPRPAIAPAPPPEPLPPPPSAPAPSPAITAAPPAHAAATQLISPAVLEANRIAGNKTIIPDAGTQDAISRAGSEAVVSTYKVCVTADGEVSLVAQLRSSGFAAYDEKIRTTIRTTWRYRPFIVDGAATPVCTALRFVYSQN